MQNWVKSDLVFDEQLTYFSVDKYSRYVTKNFNEKTGLFNPVPFIKFLLLELIIPYTQENFHLREKGRYRSNVL